MHRFQQQVMYDSDEADKLPRIKPRALNLIVSIQLMHHELLAWRVSPAFSFITVPSRYLAVGYASFPRLALEIGELCFWVFRYQHYLNPP